MVSESDGLCDCRPILRVESCLKSIEYYVQKLGFKLGWAWSKAEQRFLQHLDRAMPEFALVCRGKVQFMLSEKEQGAPGMWLHLDVDSADQLDALFAEWNRNGAKIVEPPAVRPWGNYEMRVTDLDGHMLRVASSPR